MKEKTVEKIKLGQRQKVRWTSLGIQKYYENILIYLFKALAI